MSVTSGNLKLFKPQASDFVDVNADVNNQMSKIDAFCYPLLNYRLTSLAWTAVPADAVLNAKRFSTWDNSIRVQIPGSTPGTYISNGWSEGNGSQSPWTLLNPALFVAPWVADPNAPVYYRTVNMYDGFPTSGPLYLEFKGRVINTTGYLAIAALTNNKIFFSPLGSSRSFVSQIPCGRGGLSNTDYYAYNRIAFATADGSISAARFPCGGLASAQTNGDVTNTYVLDGFKVRVLD